MSGIEKDSWWCWRPSGFKNKQTQWCSLHFQQSHGCLLSVVCSVCCRSHFHRSSVVSGSRLCQLYCLVPKTAASYLRIKIKTLYNMTSTWWRSWHCREQSYRIIQGNFTSDGWPEDLLFLCRDWNLENSGRPWEGSVRSLIKVQFLLSSTPSLTSPLPSSALSAFAVANDVTATRRVGARNNQIS